jgi:hypothetical protein
MFQITFTCDKAYKDYHTQKQKDLIAFRCLQNNPVSLFNVKLINTTYEHSERDNTNELNFSTYCLFILISKVLNNYTLTLTAYM